MHVKLGFVFVLYLYHLFCHKIFNELQNDVVKYTSSRLRIWNEVATIILFSIVFLVTLKNAVNWIYGVVGLVLFSVLLMLGVRLYQRLRGEDQSPLLLWALAERDQIGKTHLEPLESWEYTTPWFPP